MRETIKLCIIYLCFIPPLIGIHHTVQQGMGPGPGTAHSAGGGGGIAFVQSQQSSSGGGSATVSVTITSSGSAHFLAAACANQSSTGTMSITDNLGSTWTVGTPTRDTVIAGSLYPFYLANTGSGITTVTCTGSAAIGQSAVVQEFSGVVASGVLDGTQQDAATRTFGMPATWSTPTITTTNAADLLISMTYDIEASGGFTAGTGWTLPANGSAPGICMQYKIVSTTGTYSSSGSANPGGNDNILSSLFAFK